LRAFAGLAVLAAACGSAAFEGTRTVRSGITLAAAFAPNGTTLCTGGELGDLILWDLKTATPRWRAQAGDDDIGEIAWPPSGNCIAVLGRELTLHDARDGSVLLRRDAAWPHGLAISPDGRRLAFQWGLGVVAVIGLPRGEPVATFDGLGVLINSLAFANDGGALFAGTSDGRVFRLRPCDGAVDLLCRCAHGRACAALGVCGGELLTFAACGNAQLGDRVLELTGYLCAAATARSGEAFAAGGCSGEVVVWTDRGARRYTLAVGAPVAALALHPDERTLAVATFDGALRLWRAGAAPRALRAVD